MTNVLVVDGDPNARALITDALRVDGYEVLAVADGRQALSAMCRKRPAAMVLDLALPSTDATRLVRTLREQTCWGRVPLVTLAGTPYTHASSARLGARVCVRKPVQLSDLLAAVQHVAPCRGRARRRQPGVRAEAALA